MKNEITFTIACQNPDCIGGRIQTSIFGDSGYSDYTVEDGGAVEFKCTGCGKFASTDEYKEPNEPKNFFVTCDECGGHDWDSWIANVDHNENEASYMECKNCHKKQYE